MAQLLTHWALSNEPGDHLTAVLPLCVARVELVDRFLFTVMSGNTVVHGTDLLVSIVRDSYIL